MITVSHRIRHKLLFQHSAYLVNLSLVNLSLYLTTSVWGLRHMTSQLAAPDLPFRECFAGCTWMTGLAHRSTHSHRATSYDNSVVSYIMDRREAWVPCDAECNCRDMLSVDCYIATTSTTQTFWVWINLGIVLYYLARILVHSEVWSAGEDRSIGSSGPLQFYAKKVA